MKSRHKFFRTVGPEFFITHYPDASSGGIGTVSISTCMLCILAVAAGVAAQEVAGTTTIDGTEIKWEFTDAKWNTYAWSMPVATYENQIVESRYHVRDKMNLNLDGETIRTVSLDGFVKKSFTNVIDDVYDNSYDNSDFIWEVWYIVSQLTVYDKDIHEYSEGRYALETLSRGGGDCEDLVILVADMLMSSAHTSDWTIQYVVMDLDNPTDPQEVNHVILAVDDGEYLHYVEATATPDWGYFPEGVTGWWLDIVPYTDTLDFSGQDLRWMDFTQRNFAGADLAGARLTGADLTFADLRGADLSGADLQDADLYGAYLEGTNLAFADLRNADLRRAYLGDAILEGADLSGADLYNAHLNNADLTFADLSGSDLDNAILTDAILWDADLIGAKMWRTDLGDADLTFADLSGADLSGSYMGGAFLLGADLSNANLFMTNLGDAYLEDAYMQDANLRGAYMWGAYLGLADLYGANLYGADLGEADLSGANLEEANLERINWYGTRGR